MKREREERVARKLVGSDEDGRGEEDGRRWREKLDCERFLEVEGRSMS